MKQLITMIVLIAGVHLTSAAQDSKTKVDGSDYKRKVEHKGTHHTASYSRGFHRSYATHHYRRHRPMHRHYAFRRHIYHRHYAHYRHHSYSRPVVHYKKIKREGKKGDYKVKTQPWYIHSKITGFAIADLYQGSYFIIIWLPFNFVTFEGSQLLFSILPRKENSNTTMIRVIVT